MSNIQTHKFSLAGILLGLVVALIVITQANVNGWFGLGFTLLYYTFFGGVIGDNFADQSKRPLILLFGIVGGLLSLGVNYVSEPTGSYWSMLAGGLLIGGMVGSAPDVAYQSLKQGVKICLVAGFAVGLLSAVLRVTDPLLDISTNIFLLILSLALLGAIVVPLVFAPVWAILRVGLHLLSTYISKWFLE